MTIASATKTTASFAGPTCSTCRFFSPERGPNGQQNEGGRRASYAQGNCHASPPQAFPFPGPLHPVTQQPTVNITQLWPPVADTDWCGAWAGRVQ